MKKKIIMLATVSALTFALSFSGNSSSKVMATTAQPGSTGDPLVTQSYVDNKINELSKLIQQSSGGTTVLPDGTTKDALVNEIMELIKLVYGDKLEGTSAPVVSDSYTPVSLKKGQIVVGGEGTEIILRSGTGVGYCTGLNGMVNVTNGSEIINGNKVEPNNLLIVPRDDGRGVKATSDAWFIIKGTYEIIG